MENVFVSQPPAHTQGCAMINGPRSLLNDHDAQPWRLPDVAQGVTIGKGICRVDNNVADLRDPRRTRNIGDDRLDLVGPAGKGTWDGRGRPRVKHRNTPHATGFATDLPPSLPPPGKKKLVLARMHLHFRDKKGQRTSCAQIKGGCMLLQGWQTIFYIGPVYEFFFDFVCLTTPTPHPVWDLGGCGEANVCCPLVWTDPTGAAMPTRRPVNIVPRMLSCTNGSSSCSSPLAYIVAMMADVLKTQRFGVRRVSFVMCKTSVW